jgi:transposase
MEQIAAFVGWDWAEREHVVSVREAGHRGIETTRLNGSAETLHGWANQMLARFQGRTVAIAIDAGRGAVIAAFMGYPHIVIYPINPHAAASLRVALFPSGPKDDPLDSEMLLEMVEKHGDRLRPLNPADPVSRELGLLSEQRRKLTGDRQRTENRLRDTLKGYYPQAVQLLGDLSTPMACAFLRQWPSLEALQRVRAATLVAFFHKHGSRSSAKIEERLAIIGSAVPLTQDRALVRAGMQIVSALVPVLRGYLGAIDALEKAIDATYATHPDHDLIDSFPGLGKILGPRVSAILGTDRRRHDSAESLQRLTGVAPVTRRTGGRKGLALVYRRVRRPKFMHQTLVEWAGCSLEHSAWAKAFYELKREQNPQMSHWAALRALAYKWVRILFECWQKGTHYDETLHQTELVRRGSPVAAKLAA